MKKVTKLLSALAFTAFLGIANPVIAQTGDNTTMTENRSDDNDDDTGKWGLAGLLGLLGLLGRKRDRDDHHRRTV